MKDRLHLLRAATSVASRDVTTQLGDGKYHVEAYVRSQNGVGAPIAMRFRCIVEAMSGCYSSSSMVID